MKKIYLALMCMAAVTMFTACGGNANKKAVDGTTDTREVVSSDWPENEYTKLVPEPESVKITGNQAVDNVYYAGHQVVTSGWSVSDCKAYAERVKKAGFTSPGSGSDVVIQDDGTTYSFCAKNSNGMIVSLYTDGSHGAISIEKRKAQEEE